MNGLRANRAVPELGELAGRRRLDIVGVLGGALVCPALGEAHVAVVDLGHLGAERADSEAGGHCGDDICLFVISTGRRVVGVESCVVMVQSGGVVGCSHVLSEQRQPRFGVASSGT